MNHPITLGALLGGIAVVGGLMLFLGGLVGVLAGGMSDAPQVGDNLARDSLRPLIGGLAIIAFGIWMLL